MLGYTLIMKNNLNFLQKWYNSLEKSGSNIEIMNELRQKQLIKSIVMFVQLNGSTLSSSEVTKIIRDAQAIGAKSIEDQYLVLQYREVLDWLLKSAKASHLDIREQFLIDLHYLPFLSYSDDSGLIRISYKVPYSFTEYIEWLHQQSGDGLDIAINATVQFIKEHLFTDHDSSRTALFLLNVLLIQEGYPLIALDEDFLKIFLREFQSVEQGDSDEILREILMDAVRQSLFDAHCTLNPESSTKSSLLKIGQVATLTNETVPTIRYWTKQGLLLVSDHSEGGYQLYEPSVVDVVLKIRFLQREKRLTVAEIKNNL